MSELEEGDPRNTAEVNALLLHVNRIFQGRPFSGSLVEQINEVIAQHAILFKQRYGHEFPPLTPLVLPASKQIVLYRKDLDDETIRLKLMFLLRAFAMERIPVSVMELAIAVKYCWPKYTAPIEDIRADRKTTILLN